MLGPWTPGGPSDAFAEAELVVRPSLLAALDVPFKALGGIAVFALPILISSAAHADQPSGLAGVQLFLELVQLVPAFFLAFAPAVRILFTRYVIDHEGIRVSFQVLARSESRVAWAKVTALRHRRTLVDRVFGIERLDVVAYGEKGTTLHLVGLRGAAALRDLAARKMRAHASVRGLFAND